MASSVLPRFQPRLIWLATCCAVGRVWARVGEETEMEMAASSNAQSTVPRHFAAEGLRSDIGPPGCSVHRSPGREVEPPLFRRREMAVMPRAWYLTPYVLAPGSMLCHTWTHGELHAVEI